ncbi:hypothetical protein T4D_6852 [Trichinella pseudospiralis]|uniref:Uncharacterized protein n=1 Tax=Trichinella pseudospiralis TaxID=6337 RepID=A0A0V1DSJ2_TRIPS|nr:hypothetical protein T4D_6852 [Trichinella pseudospiralis]
MCWDLRFMLRSPSPLGFLFGQRGSIDNKNGICVARC